MENKKVIAFDTTQITSKANGNNPQPGDPCHPLAAGAHAPSIIEENKVIEDLVIAMHETGNGFWQEGEQAGTLRAEGENRPSRPSNVVSIKSIVRRLTPVECERLMGFPDGYTDIKPNGKPTADGSRYKALGNSMGVNCMRWIGMRIQIVEEIING